MGLVLTRHPGQSVIIGPDIEVSVASVDGKQVRLNIDAPRHIQIDRREVYVQKTTEKQNGS